MYSKITYFLISGLLVGNSLFAQIEDKKGIVAKDAELTKVQDGFSFTEGPAINRFGDVFFTDQPNNRIHKWNAISNEVTVFMEDAGRSNGMYFMLDGTLISCADEQNELWSIQTTGEKEVLVNSFRGKKLNGPNDVWVRPKGGLYFTDPLYPRPYWEGIRDKDMQQDGQHVYFLSADRSELFRVAEDLVKPNGIVGSPDGKYLYVADIGDNKTYRYEIREDGYLTNKTLFCDMGSDGMTIDDRGNIYLTGNGVTVFDRKGEQIAHIPVPAKWTANVVFGALDRKTLFITAMDAVYTLQMKTRGVW
ncbi:SMP-30/gluconolactonase/LRE family protein [Algoriphagus sp. CAU 1675]|uniref:SMP-30/gluconolactonase/LRE family protein n=1 Tax=Algoriphagus sp. CAU 1675 TaxID=3032597 RepID=UPI0023DAA2AA|nr:SMP-30/gluconolactonase/LRE family protein [Algoriphagus sp. CAU 1675]MDF2157975.1 SMP-30/gluconolactonase/LRE family protein [Algoriphagus sp. CAU 1675]